jgi:DNA-binding beta-propeller fold protein YncE
MVLRRIDRDGRLLNDITVSRGGQISGDTTAMSADGRSLYAWDPIKAQLSRIDLATGEKTVGPAAATAATGDAGGPLAAFGAWLAPSVAAKSFLQSAVVVSPDGRRVYALGVTNGATEREMSGSSGVYAFDAASLDLVGHWDPTADFVSMALSPDGRFLYAAGAPGIDAAGRVLVNQASSITVYEAATGERRLIAGQLGRLMLFFARPVLD